MLQSKNYIAIPPGETIKEQLEMRGVSQKEFALKMGSSEKFISQLIRGEVELTADIALKLASILGVPAKFWLNLEAIYKENRQRVKEETEQNYVAAWHRVSENKKR